MLSQRALEVFHEVMRFGSISSAAAELNLSQPAVSRHIKELEVSTGLVLFDRSKQRMVPTQQALRLLSEVERAFVGLRELESRLGQIATGGADKLTVAGMPNLAATVIPDACSDVAGNFPDLTIEIQSARTANILPRVVGGLYDIGAVALRRNANGLRVVWRAELAYHCILPPGHPLEAREVVTPADLDGAPMIGFSDTTVTGVQLDRLTAALPNPPSVRMRVHLSASASRLVAGGRWLAVVDPFAAASHAAAGGISRPFESSARFSIFLVVREDMAMRDPVEAFIAGFDERVAAVLTVLSGAPLAPQFPAIA